VGVRLGAWAADEPRRLPHGAVVVRQGDPLECLFLVTSGVVRLSSVTVEGREAIVGLLGIGDVFGESALLSRPSPVEARAVGPARIVALPLEHVVEILRHHPATSAELLRLVASRLHRTSRALEEALVGTVTSRISGRLCDLAEGHGVRDVDGVRIPLALTQEELARMVGASREAVNRSLGGLAARGLVRTSGRTIVIPDPEALEGTAVRR
jgi:CRP/FNR family transcriptional regulator